MRYLYRLLRAFVAAEDAERTDAKTKALDEANRLKQSEIDLRRAEYQRRFDLGPLGVKVMRQRIVELEEKVAELEAKALHEREQRRVADSIRIVSDSTSSIWRRRWKQQH